MTDKCEVPHCRGNSEVCYLGKWLCDKHWKEVCIATASEQYIGSD